MIIVLSKNVSDGAASRRTKVLKGSKTHERLVEPRRIVTWRRKRLLKDAKVLLCQRLRLKCARLIGYLSRLRADTGGDWRGGVHERATVERVHRSRETTLEMLLWGRWGRWRLMARFNAFSRAAAVLWRDNWVIGGTLSFALVAGLHPDDSRYCRRRGIGDAQSGKEIEKGEGRREMGDGGVSRWMESRGLKHTR